ncbi:transposase family protein [Neopusillimonas aromaticivorans]|uniref:transposase family protein n=1 Tax=Neopusillimonas aromaticivorans TaxID=2979868 RepID=UPI003D9F813F
MELKGPRQSAKCAHNLSEVIFMATCSLLCGADGCNAIAFFARMREGWFRQFLCRTC